MTFDTLRLSIISLMLLFYALEGDPPWFALAFPDLASWHPSMASCKVRGRLESLKPFCLWWLFCDGYCGQKPNELLKSQSWRHPESFRVRSDLATTLTNNGLIPE